jgi:hypothetical protein
VQVGFRKAEPAVAVKIVGLLELVPQQIQNHDLAARPQYLVGTGDALFGIGGVMEGLAQHHQINALRLDGRVFQVAQAEFQVLELVLFRLVGAEGHHRSELSTAMTFLARRASNSLNKPFARPKSAMTSGGSTRKSSCPKACQERPGP